MLRSLTPCQLSKGRIHPSEESVCTLKMRCQIILVDLIVLILCSEEVGFTSCGQENGDPNDQNRLYWPRHYTYLRIFGSVDSEVLLIPN